MAKITTGNTDLIKNYYYLASDFDNPFDALQSVLDSTFLSDVVETKSSAGGLIMKMSDSSSVNLTGAFPGDDPTKWNVSKAQIVLPNSTIVNLAGKIKFDSAGDLLDTSEFTSAEFIDPKLAFDGVQQVVRGNFVGSITFAYTDNNSIDLTANIKEWTRYFSDGSSLSFQEARYYNTSKLWTGSTNAVTLKDAGGSTILGITDLGILKENSEMQDALTSADKFIEYFLKGNDSITGSTRNDYIYSGAGNDSVNAGDGSDLLVGGDGAGNDIYDGGKGIDTIKYSSANANIIVNLTKGTATSSSGSDAAGIGTDKLKNIEYIVAGNYSDNLTGSKDANSIVGGAGNDTIDGGLKNDTLVGGDGADVFVFSTKPSSNNIDAIDFEPGVDKLQLSGRIFAKLKSGADFLGLGSVSDSPTHYLIYDSTSGKLSYDADGSAVKIKPVDIAFIGTNLNLTSSDVIVV